MRRKVHIVGAGLAGLSAATLLAEQGETVVVHEANAQAGGRCRSYHDHGLGLVIDNGNHLLLSGNGAARSYLRRIGAEARLVGPAEAEFPFVDLQSGERWTLRPNAGRFPAWIFDPSRRVPGTRALDYVPLARLLMGSGERAVGDILTGRGVLYDRLTRPVLLAALNTEPPEGAAALAGAVMRETLAAGGEACRPLIARDGLSAAFVDPALAFVIERGGDVRLGHEARSLAFGDGAVAALQFADETIALADRDAVILAVPPWIAATLVPGLTTPTQFRAIVNAHFRFVPPPHIPPITGVVNGLVEWLFSFPDRLSVTISAADRLLSEPREALATQIWSDVARIAGIAALLPPWQIVRERRATFAATAAENAKRPLPRTRFRNLVLAGDWTATGLPATIEGAIRSGRNAVAALHAIE